MLRRMNFLVTGSSEATLHKPDPATPDSRKSHMTAFREGETAVEPKR